MILCYRALLGSSTDKLKIFCHAIKYILVLLKEVWSFKKFGPLCLTQQNFICDSKT